jgi:hypothetical protein
MIHIHHYQQCSPRTIERNNIEDLGGILIKGQDH